MDQSLLAVMSTWYFGVFVLLAGLCIGSFLNVCIYRLPAGKSIVWPGSHCMACQTPIAWYDNIPVASYLVLRGRCRKCGAGFSSRYMIVELVTGLLFFGYWLAFYRYGLRDGAYLPGVYLVYMTLAAALLASGIIDYDRKEIYTAVTNFALGVGLVGSMLWPEIQRVGSYNHDLAARTGWEPTDALLMSLVGAAVGAGLINITRYLGTLAFRKEAMGGGDAYLMAAIGGVLGWEAAVLVFFLAPFIGLPMGIWQVLRSRREEPPAEAKPVAEAKGAAKPGRPGAAKSKPQVVDEAEEFAPPVLHHGTFLTTILGLALLIVAAVLAKAEWGLGARAVLLASLLAFGASMIYLRREEEPPAPSEDEPLPEGDSHEIPYGPSLGLAAGVVMLMQDHLVAWFGPGVQNVWHILVG